MAMWKYAGHFTKPSRVFSTSNKVSGPRKRKRYFWRNKKRPSRKPVKFLKLSKLLDTMYYRRVSSGYKKLT